MGFNPMSNCRRTRTSIAIRSRRSLDFNPAVNLLDPEALHVDLDAELRRTYGRKETKLAVMMQWARLCSQQCHPAHGTLRAACCCSSTSIGKTVAGTVRDRVRNGALLCVVLVRMALSLRQYSFSCRIFEASLTGNVLELITAGDEPRDLGGSALL